MGTLRDLQFALQLKIEELRQRDALIDELELELDAKDDLIRRLQTELDRMRATLSTPGASAAGCLALRNSSQRVKRRAVMAESTRWDDKQFPPQAPTSSHSKSPECVELIREALMESGLMRHLERGQQLALLDCMEPATVSHGTCLTREGDKASFAYVIEEGRIEESKAGHKLQTLEAGRLFGEIALLHDHTCSTTLTETSILFFSSCCCHYSEGDYLIHHGSPGDSFFIVSQGQVKLTERKSVSEEPMSLNTLGRGDWFGERALRGEDSRIVSAVAVGDVTCLVMERDPFRRLVSCLEEDSKAGRENRETKRSEEEEEVPFPADLSLADFQVVCCLGEGQFSTLELVHYKGDLRRTYTLKIIKKSAVQSCGQQGRMQTERRILMEADCPFIVRLYQTFRDAECLYMLLEACLGGELWTLLRERGTFDEASTRFYGTCVVEALSYLHSRGIAHRDIRPENIHLDQHGYAKLVGFGCAKRIGSRGKSWTFCGSVGYVAPEVILCKGHTTAVDYWALGILIYELLSGRLPFPALDPLKAYVGILEGIDAVEFPKPIGKAAANLIKRLCRSNPSERLGSHRSGVKDIYRHKWFERFDWEGVRQRSVTPPILPCIHHAQEQQDCRSPHDNNGNTSEICDWDKDF
ncbi:cGMP-dependent protein kinase 1 [Engraulis encrasicolus]|uniref:cGMP-dependent protein kinase 1 n=1 Tax=Engraulis encrasicolus TaxID=184585 RepID=UPI002FCF1616